MCAVFFIRKIDTVYQNVNQITVVFQTINVALNKVVEKENYFVLCNLVRRTEKGRLRRRGWGLRWEKAQKGGKGTNLRGFFED